MPRLIKEGQVIFDGEHTKAELQAQANKKLELLEIAGEWLGIDDIVGFFMSLEPNTLFRFVPYEKAKVIDDFRREYADAESKNWNWNYRAKQNT